MFTTGPIFEDTENYWDSNTPLFGLPKYMGCGSLSYFGGGNILTANAVIKTIYPNIEPHNVVYFSISMVLQGYYAYSDYLRVIFADSSGSAQTDYWWAPNVWVNAFACCSCYDLQIKGRAMHTGSNLMLKLTAGNSWFASFGIRKIYLRVATEPSPTTSICVTSTGFPSNGYGIADLCTCPKGQFHTPGGCVQCHGSCEECSGSTAADCFTCAYGYYHDGTQCQPCSATCTDCGTCGYCSEDNYNMDYTCVPDCNLPFLKTIYFDHRYCVSPCKDTSEILYADGSCRPTCPPPLVEVQVYTRKVCSLPCPSTKTTIWDGTTYTCSNSPCSFPYKDMVYGGALKVCEYPCNIATEVYYSHNNTCLPSCDFPFALKMYGVVPICEKPCPPTQYYESWDKVCRLNCPPLLQKQFLNGVWVCHPPQCGAQYCKVCGPAPLNQCQDYYFCNTTVSRFCEPYYKYQLKIEPIRPELNGQTLLVTVDPLQGIDPGPEDYLTLSIVNFQSPDDYIYTINKLSTGTFHVEIYIQRKVNTTGMNASFAYGAGLTNYYILPRLTYIDENTQAAAKTVKKGSQIAFILFAISIIGCVLGGGMSSIWTAMPESQYAYYLLYLNVDYLHHTEVYLESLSSYDVLIDSPDDDDEHLDMSFRNFLPRKFFIMDYLPDFMDNTEQVFTQTLVVIVALIIAAIAIKYIRFSGRGIQVLRLLRWIRNGFMWNMLIRQMLTYALPLFVASWIQMYSGIFGGPSYLPSVILAGLTMLFFFVFFIKMLSLINNIPKNKQEMVIYDRKYGTLWEDLDTSMTSRYYYWLVAVRGCVMAYLVVFVSIYPYVQVCSLILCQCGVVSLFFKKWGFRQVFENPLLNRVTMSEEISLLLIKIMILIYMVMTMYVGDKTLILVGWIVVLPGAVNQIIQTLYSTGIQVHEKIQEFKAVQALLEKKRLKRLKKIRRINRIGKHSPVRNPKQTTSTTDIDLNSSMATMI